MKHHSLLLSAALCTAIILAFGLTGCREDTIIKSSLTPAVDNIHTFGVGPEFNNGTDTISMRTKTVHEDSVVTSTRNGFPIFHALGVVNDPFAGKTVGSIFMQVVPTAVKFAIPSGTTINDLYLVLPYAGFTWGDTTTTSEQTYTVYQVADTFNKDTTYYNNSSLKTAATAISSPTKIYTGRLGTGVIGDSAIVNGVKKTPQLRIKLTDAFRDLFLSKLAHDTTFPAFTSSLPGLYIVPDSGNSARAIPYFRLNGTADLYGSAAIVAYGRSSAGTDTAFQFPYIEQYSAHFNRITRNYSTEVQKLRNSLATDDSIVVMQNGPGLAVDLVLPNIQNLPKGVIINRAELVFTKIPAPEDDRFYGPARLYPSGINLTGLHYTVADRYPINDQSLNFIDGTPRTVVKGGTTVTEYHLNIPREVQQAMITARPGGLHLRIAGTINFPAAYRVVLGGHANSNPIYRPYINIIYSKQ